MQMNSERFLKKHLQTESKMKKSILIGGLMLFAALPSMAQKGKVTSAMVNLQAGDVLKAKENIDEATVNEESKIMAKTWLYRGDVYSRIYEAKVFFPQNPEALFIAKDAYFKAFELELNPKKKDDVQPGLTNLANYFYLEGVSFFQASKWEPAYKNFRAALDVDEFLIKNNLKTVVDTNFYFVVALTAFNSGNTDDAIYASEKLLDMDYKNEVVYVIASESYKLKGLNDKFLSTLEKGRVKYPNNLDLLLKEINYYISEDKPDILIGKLDAAIKLDAKNASLYQALGNVYDKMKDKEKAILNYDKAIELNPEFFEAYYNKATIYFSDAMEFVGKMNDENDSKKYEILKGQRDALLKDKALPLFLKAYAISPDDVSVIKALREVYARLNMMDELSKLPKK